jgi:hypothetical protein
MTRGQVFGSMLILTLGVVGLSELAGEVVATNLTSVPSTVVVRVMRPNREELIVGALVLAGTAIMRGSRSVSLSDSKTGRPST